MEVQDLLNKIQQELKAPKGQYNTFGKFAYRSCEDILEAVKPLLGRAVLLFNDDLVLIGDRYYIKATVTLRLGMDHIDVTALARESLTKKGMDDSQITGTASSYARKYALNGLFCIDDSKDADDDKPDPPKLPKPTVDEKKVIGLIFDSMLDFQPEDKRMDIDLLTNRIYEVSGKYPDDQEKVGDIAKWLVKNNTMNFICKDKEIG